MQLQLSVFFFDASRDYLPHYRKFQLDIDGKVSNLLEAIKKRDEEFDYDLKQPLKINGTMVLPSSDLRKIVDLLGSDLTIEPASKYRSINDLVIDERDFWNAWKLIEPYCDMEDRFFFASQKDLHYASATLEFDKSYIGDAVLVTAHRVIKKGNASKEEILKAISEDVSGLWSCEFEVGILDGKDYSDVITELQKMARAPKIDLTQKLSYLFAKKKEVPLVERLEDVPVALYRVDAAWLNEQGARIVSYKRCNKKAGQSLVEYNPELAYKKGAALLLDAMDSGAELLVTGSKEDAEYFRSHFGKFERVSGREIYIEIVALEELQSMKLKENA